MKIFEQEQILTVLFQIIGTTTREGSSRNAESPTSSTTKTVSSILSFRSKSRCDKCRVIWINGGLKNLLLLNFTLTLFQSYRMVKEQRAAMM
jgi:hypothetical protein